MPHDSHHGHRHQAHPGGHGHEPQGHAHAHAHDRGWAGFLRYVSILPRMWTSEVSAAVVGLVAPRRGEHVVEIGSGMGAAIPATAQSGADYVAVDPTPYMRRILRLRRLAHSGRRRIRVAEGAAETIPVADAGADAVWSVNTMHHWTDADRALREIHRVLRPGGRLLLVDEEFDDPRHPAHAQFLRRRARHAHTFATVEPSAIAAKLQTLGFSSATGSLELIAGRPAKVVRGVKA